MKVLLANPPCRIPIDDRYERFFVRAGCRYPFSILKRKDEKPGYMPFPFYLAYAAALLEKVGVKASVIDGVALNLTEQEFLRRAIEKVPDIVLFETSTPTIASDLRIARELKDAIRCRIVLCGPHVTQFPKEILETSNFLDYILMREYEVGFLNLVERLSSGGDPSDLKGIAYRANGDYVRVNPIAEAIDPLDQLPFPARHLFPTEEGPDMSVYWDGFCQYKPAIQMHATRGCAFHCNFCVWTQVMYEKGKHRVFSVSRVVDEMEHVINRYGAREIYFDDDDFVINRKHVLAFCDEIKRRELRIPWSAMGDAMAVTPEVIDAMADAGCVGMKFGVESGDLKVLDEIDKPVKLDKVIEVARHCADRGIRTRASFSFGLLGETVDSMEKTLSFAKELDVDSVIFSICTPLPGSLYYEQAREKGILMHQEWSEYDSAHGCVVRFNGLNPGQVEEFYKKASGEWRRAKLCSPHWIWRQMRYFTRVIEGQGWNGVVQRAGRALGSIRS